MNYDEITNQQEQTFSAESNSAQSKPQLDRTRLIIFVAIVLGGLLVGTLIGYMSGKNAEIDSRVVNNLTEERTKRDEEINAKKEELTRLKGEVGSLRDEKSGLESVILQAKDYKENKVAKDGEIAEKTATIEQLDAQISQKQGELDTLTGNVVKAKSAPKVLSAGEFVGGTDIPAGRYNVSGSSNFVVWSSTGSLKVNTILGNSSVGSGDYVCTLSSGDRIKCSAKTTFTPID